MRMFGLPDDELIANLERMRQRACAYGSGPDGRCDCKFGVTGTSEQTGCPELRQAITMLQGKFDEIAVINLGREQQATDALRQIKQIIDRSLPV